MKLWLCSNCKHRIKSKFCPICKTNKHTKIIKEENNMVEIKQLNKEDYSEARKEAMIEIERKKQEQMEDENMANNKKNGKDKLSNKEKEEIASKLIKQIDVDGIKEAKLKRGIFSTAYRLCK